MNRNDLDPEEQEIMNAGRELDRIIATKIMGMDLERTWSVPYYSTEIAAAWQVVEVMRQRDYSFVIDTGARRVSIYHTSWVTNDIYQARAMPTHVGDLPHSICLAALEATP